MERELVILLFSCLFTMSLCEGALRMRAAWSLGSGTLLPSLSGEVGRMSSLYSSIPGYLGKLEKCT